MSDPLKLLKQFNVDKKEVTERDGKIYFGDYCWPKSFKTNYEIKIKGQEEKEYYTLESLLFFLKNKDVIHPEYCKLAADASIPAIRRPDRKDLLAYLNGETDTYVKNVTQEPKGRKRPAPGNQSMPKKNRRR